MIRHSVRNRLLTALVCLAIVPLLLLGGILSWQSVTSHSRQIQELQQVLTRQVSEIFSLYVHEQEQKLMALLRVHHLAEMTQEQRTREFLLFLAASNEKKHSHVFNEIVFLNAEGVEAGRVSRVQPVAGTTPRDRSDKEEFLLPRRTGKRYFGPVHFDTVTSDPLMKVAIPIHDLRTLRFQGVLVAEMNLIAMRRVVSDARIGDSGIAFVTDQDGRVVVHPNLSVVLRGTRFKPPAKPTIMLGTGGEQAEVAALQITFTGRTLFAVTELPVAEAFRQLRYTMITIGVFLLLTLSGAVGLWFVLVRQTVRPVESLVATARRITGGDLTSRVELDRQDEFGDLAASFNSMTAQLVATISDLEGERDFVRNVIESLSHPFYVVNVSDYTIKLANSAAGSGALTETSTCYEFTHHADKPCCGPDHPCTIAKICKTGNPVVVEHQHSQGNLPSRTYEVYGYPIFDASGQITQVIEYNIDITERKMLEEQLRQSQKLEAVGSLAGGVAHDFNNILTAILGYSEVAMMTLEEDDPLRKRFTAIHAAGERAATLTRQLLAFSRKQVMELKVINLHTLIRNLAKMLTRLIGENIEMKLLLDKKIGNIKADPGQVEQVLMNLVVNARDAMPDGGHLTIETDMMDLDEGYCRAHPEVAPGRYILLCVTDTGHGMSPEVQERIFEPFFTTKAKGAGTGLGLSMLYGIMKQLNGHVFVYSEPGIGSTFKIYFPEERGEEEVTTAAKGAAEEPMPQGTETLLVVDDEPSIRHMVSDTLQALGYKVLMAESGKDALRIFQESDGKIDLLLTDVVMPGMSGRELAEALQPLKPKLKVLFMSGYTDNIIVRQGVLKPGVMFTHKPLVPSRLAAKIRRILDTP